MRTLYFTTLALTTLTLNACMMLGPRPGSTAQQGSLVTQEQKDALRAQEAQADAMEKQMGAAEEEQIKKGEKDLTKALKLALGKQAQAARLAPTRIVERSPRRFTESQDRSQHRTRQGRRRQASGAELFDPQRQLHFESTEALAENRGAESQPSRAKIRPRRVKTRSQDQRLALSSLESVDGSHASQQQTSDV